MLYYYFLLLENDYLTVKAKTKSHNINFQISTLI
jgi:hypothetical protein